MTDQPTIPSTGDEADPTETFGAPEGMPTGAQAVDLNESELEGDEAFADLGDDPGATLEVEDVASIDPAMVELQTAAEAEAAGLQHWTAPPTGKVPAVLLDKEAEEKGSGVSGPSWQGGDGSDWEGPDLAEVFANTGDLVVGATTGNVYGEDDDDEPVAEYRRPAAASDLLENSSVARKMDITEPATDSNPSTRSDDRELLAASEADDSIPSIDDIKFAEPSRGDSTLFGGPDPADDLSDLLPAESTDSSEHREIESGSLAGSDEEPEAESVSSDLLSRVLVASGMVVVVGAAFYYGALTALLLVTAIGLLAVLELYNAMRQARLRPAILLGMVATTAAPLIAYYRGEVVFPLIMALSVIFGCLWYLVGADTERPVLNLSLTLLGVLWVGGLGSFAGLMLRVPDGGVGLLLTTLALVAMSDSGAYLGGRAYGATPFHAISPKKTWEGSLTGFGAAVFGGLIIGVTDVASIWGGAILPPVLIGAVVGVLGPIGDLAESLVKRDLGVKDMGSLLPGHGGIFDRVDATLFALPGAYYVAAVLGLIP